MHDCFVFYLINIINSNKLKSLCLILALLRNDSIALVRPINYF